MTYVVSKKENYFYFIINIIIFFNPQHGSVNFNLLQSILHVVVQQLELVQCKVEFRGKDGEKVQNLMTAVKPEATVKITEYVVSPAKDAGKVLNRNTPQKGIYNHVVSWRKKGN